MAKLKGTGGSGLENLSLPGKIAVGLVFALMVGAAYFVVFYGEIDGNIASQVQLKAAKERELTQAREADAEHNKDMTELERRKAIALKQKKILPDDSEWAPFLATLQSAATISGVQLSSWTPQDEAPESFYMKVPMKVKVEGRYHQVAKFFHSVGQSDRIINMANIQMKISKASLASKPTAEKKLRPGQEEAISPGEETVQVEVEALATAFRAAKGGESEADPKDKRKKASKRPEKK